MSHGWACAERANTIYYSIRIAKIIVTVGWKHFYSDCTFILIINGIMIIIKYKYISFCLLFRSWGKFCVIGALTTFWTSSTLAKSLLMITFCIIKFIMTRKITKTNKHFRMSTECLVCTVSFIPGIVWSVFSSHHISIHEIQLLKLLKNLIVRPSVWYKYTI